MRVEVLLARPGTLVRREVDLPPGATIRDAVGASGLVHPEARWAAGRYGKLLDPDSPLVDGDRVEIYRPLAADPNEQRRRQAKRLRRP